MLAVLFMCNSVYHNIAGKSGKWLIVVPEAKISNSKPGVVKAIKIVREKFFNFDPDFFQKVFKIFLHC